jgi:hypothetical protein
MSDYGDDNNIDWDNNDDSENHEEVAPPAESNSFNPPPVISGNYAEPVAFNEVERVEAVDSEHGSIVSVEATGEGEHMTVIQVDSRGNQITTVVDMALPPLDEGEARDITEKIKGTTNLLYLLIKRAHAGKAYKALGYSSFEAYVREEFNYSRSYAYKLLNQATVIEAIETVAPEGTEVYVGELTARGLKGSLPELLEDIEERTADASPEEAKHLIEDSIRDFQNRKEEEESFDEDFDDDFDSNDFSNSPSSPIEYIDDDDDSLDEFLGGDDPTLIVQKLEGLWNLINGLQNFSDLSDNANLDDLLPLIPEDKSEEITSLINTNIQWLDTLKTAWADFRANNPVSDNGNNENEDFDVDNDGDIEF